MYDNIENNNFTISTSIFFSYYYRVISCVVVFDLVFYSFMIPQNKQSTLMKKEVESQI